mmetsp:Transcript_1332/g.3401  ORF Transcript_1332/g.3401 Transcript_1332/m.3401 type:complete len:89 (-) Transcript_1332:79-345(-)|eukprot:CAMPEP_0173432130 /NCGR_PEP_ID=MMETSP1357-20121228/10040_1 /TAXON_ID=77926 /ORGANISM="Hemiselmis rufescens, Strain PCC563" /LENGTH=88 /DNA_ID=CAMNT_0014396689 /DNA_START=135 /DNA_END=401 /DNA_ORIENTATION=+
MGFHLAAYYKLSADHSRCKNGIAMGNNTASWHQGTCQATAGYTQLARGSFFGNKQYVKPGPPPDYSHYHIPSWADPHYSSSGNDRNFG